MYQQQQQSHWQAPSQWRAHHVLEVYVLVTRLHDHGSVVGDDAVSGSGWWKAWISTVVHLARKQLRWGRCAKKYKNSHTKQTPPSVMRQRCDTHPCTQASAHLNAQYREHCPHKQRQRCSRAQATDGLEQRVHHQPQARAFGNHTQGPQAAQQTDAADKAWWKRRGNATTHHHHHQHGHGETQRETKQHTWARRERRDNIRAHYLCWSWTRTR